MPKRREEEWGSYKNLFDLSGRTALVVGAGGGLAGETCFGLSQFGAMIFFSSRASDFVTSHTFFVDGGCTIS